MTLELTNQEIYQLWAWLNVPLHGTQSRMRNRFAKMIMDDYQKIIDQRNNILKEHADKNDKGESIIENGRYKISPENETKVVKLVDDFLKEKKKYAIGKEEKGWCREVKSVLLRSDAQKVDTQVGFIYDSVISKLETVIE